MSVTRRRAIWILAVMGLLLNGQSVIAADEEPVVVKYERGETDLAILNAGVRYFNNRNYLLDEIPSEVTGLTFSRRPIRNPADVTLTIPAGATVYVLVDSETGKNKNLKGVRDLNAWLSNSGWIKVAEFTTDKSPMFGEIYRQQFSAAKNLTITSAGNSGVTVAAKNLGLAGVNNASKNSRFPLRRHLCFLLTRLMINR